MRRGDWGPGKVFLDSESVGTGREITGKSNQRNPATCSKSNPAVRNLDWGLKSGGCTFASSLEAPHPGSLAPHFFPFPSFCSPKSVHYNHLQGANLSSPLASSRPCSSSRAGTKGLLQLF